MKIALIQQDLVWGNPEENRKKVGKAIDQNPGADIYILPEMWTTGFVTNPKGVAERVQGEFKGSRVQEFKGSGFPESVGWMVEKARDVDAAIAGSIAVEEEDGRFFNRFYFVEPSGKITTYDKSHLFKYGGEGLHFSAGKEKVVVEFRGVKILLEICYDLRFPMWCRNQIMDDGKAMYDLIIYSADWPLSRKLAWDVFIQARAIENQCYVAAVNRIGRDDWGEYFGGSALVHPYGHHIAECGTDKECVTMGEIDMAQLERYRTKFPVLNDIIWQTDFS